MMQRRAFLGGALTTMSAGTLRAPSATAQAVVPAPAEPLVWPVVTKVPAGIRSFAGHTDTVPDIVGRIGTPANLVIFTEGNHLMALLSDDILGAFPAWAKSQPRYADLDLPDIVMAGPGPLRQLRQLGAIEPQARFFSRNRGFALLVRKGNPLGIHGLVDIARSGGRVALPEAASEPEARARYRAAVDDLIGKPAADELFAAETPNFPGRIGIVHRDLPEMVARGYADVALTQYHLISYWTRIFPNHFALVPVSGAERFFVKIAFGRVVDPLRPRALMAFEEFFFSRARDVYPRYDFARMNDDEYAAPLALD
jgi:Bacterial extracellular solute-binding protein